MHPWVLRIFLAALVAAGVAFVPAVEQTRGRDQFRLDFDFSSSVPGALTIFRDSGLGFAAVVSVPVVDPGGGPKPYRVPLVPRRYVRWRIDLPAGAHFTLSNVRIVDARAGLEFPLTLSTAAAVQGIAVDALEGRRLSGAVAADEPARIQLTPDTAAVLLLDSDEVRAVVGTWLVVFGLALLGIAIADTAAGERRIGRGLVARCRARPAAAVVVAACLGAAAATYPIFLGKSFVAPGNGGASFLYDVSPFGYGFHDSGAEDVRGPDVAAMMWTVLHYRMVQATAIADGEFPWWNRYNQVGLPLWGQGQSFMLDPIHLVSLWWSDVALGADIKYVLARFVFAAGVGLAALAATSSWWAAALVAAASAFNGQFTSWMNHPAQFSLVYAPWILYGYFLLLRANGAIRQAVAGTVIALASTLLIYASPPKEAFALQLCVHLAGSAALIVAIRSGAPRRLIGVAAAGGVAAVLMSAPGWLLFLDTLRRTATLYDRPGAALADLPGLMTFALGAMSSLHVSASISPLMSAFVLLGVLSPRGMPAPVVGAVAGAAAGVALALGLVPAETLIRLPLVSNIQRVGEVFLNAASVPLMVVAAWGLRQAREWPLLDVRDAATAVRLAVWIGGAAVLGFLVLAAGDYRSPFFALSAISVLAMVGLPLLPVGSEGGFRLVPGVGFGVVAAVLLVPGGLQLDTGWAALDRLLVQPRGREQLERPSPTIDRLHQAAVPFRVAPAGTVLQGGIPGLFKLEGVTGGDALWGPGLYDLAGRFQASRFPWSFLAGTSDDEIRRIGPLLDLLNVKYIVAADWSGHPDDPLRVIERPTAWPRAFFVDRVEEHEDSRDLARRIAADTSAPFATVYSRDAAAAPATAAIRGRATVTVPATGYRLTANTTTFSIAAPAAGVAVLGETYLPEDLVAEVNGQPVSCFQVNHLMRGVAIPAAGEWTITFRYRPARLTLSLWLAAGGVLALAGIWAVSCWPGFFARPKNSGGQPT